MKIDAEFRSLIPALRAEELRDLEASIVADGCRDALVVWNGILLDGHNRYDICTKHGIKYRTVDAPSSIRTREDAADWIDANQLGRRNLTPDAFTLLLGRRYNRMKRTKAEAGSKGGLSKGQNDTCLESTAAKLAAANAVSEATVKRAGKFAAEVEKKPELMDAINKRVPVQKVRKAVAKKEREDTEAAAIVEVADEEHLVECSDFRSYLGACDADVIITDPPYPKEYLPLYGELAQMAKRFSLVAVMCGQSYLPDVLAAMSKHLTYCWTFAYMTPGGQAVQLWDRQVLTFWKPVLVFGNLPEWAGDVVKSPVNANEKNDHEWGQSVGGMQDLIRRVTLPGQTICDPFMGGGTTAVAALTTGRRIVGCDIDPESVKTTLRRIARCRK